MDIISISFLALTLSIIGLIVQILNHILTTRKTFPTIEIKAYRLPPYENKNEDSLIVIKNIGTSIAYKVTAIIKFSYTEKQVKIDFEKGYFLAINESYKNFIKFPEPSTGERFYIEVKVKFSISKIGFKTTYIEKIYSDEYFITSNYNQYKSERLHD